MSRYENISISPKLPLYIILALFVGLVLWSGIYTVQTGQQAAVSRFGKFVNVTDEGLHFKIPFVDTADVIIVRNTSYAFNDLEVSTKDMQSILLNMVVQITVTDLDTLYRKYRKITLIALLIQEYEKLSKPISVNILLKNLLAKDRNFQ